MMKAINIKRRIQLGDIGSTIQTQYVEAKGFSVVQRFLWSWYWSKIS